MSSCNQSSLSVALLLCLTAVIALTLTVDLASGKGLREEFTWSRITYADVPSSNRFGGERSYRPSYGGGSGGGYRPGGTSGGGIAFPDDDGGVVRPSRPTRPSKTTTTTQAPSDDDTEQQDEEYIYQNNIPMGANRWRNKLFITVPRRRAGVPSTLNYVDADSAERHNLPLKSYPNLETNQLGVTEGNDHRLTSAYRVAIDPCDRLWLVDTGVLEIPGNRQRIQPQAVVIIDLKTDKVLRRYNLKPSDTTIDTALASITVDVTSRTCNDAYAYIPDLAGYGLIVYSFKQNDSWRVTHNYFFLEPNAGEFDVGGHQFQWTDGIFSIALSSIKPDGFRDVYFQSMAGFNMYRVSSQVLREKHLATRSYHAADFEIVANRGNNSQTSTTDLHEPSGLMFLSLVNQNAMGCWNTNRQIRSPSDIGIVQKDDEKMIYPCDLKVDGDDVILLTNTMPVFLYGQLDYDKTNFRVWINNVYEAVKGTPCAGPATGGGSSGGKYRN